MKEILLNGNNFKTLVEFYDEVQKKLTKNLGWEIGRNLDAFNDVLLGGFGIHSVREPLTLIWENSDKSRVDLGFPETVKYVEKKLVRCHPLNILDVQKQLEMAKAGEGQTVFEKILAIIRDHKHIKLILK